MNLPSLYVPFFIINTKMFIIEREINYKKINQGQKGDSL